MTPERVLEFWLQDLETKDWYIARDDVDDRIRQEFLPTWQEAMDGGLGLWLTDASGVLAYLIVTDQFPRNMFRGDARSFASDPMALAVSRAAIEKDMDQSIDEPQRQFFFLPFMHSEQLTDQDDSVRLIQERMPQTGADTLLHARAHREVIRRYGRFPYRNAALGRTSTKAEVEFMASGAYASVVQELRSAS